MIPQLKVRMKRLFIILGALLCAQSALPMQGIQRVISRYPKSTALLTAASSGYLYSVYKRKKVYDYAVQRLEGKLEESYVQAQRTRDQWQAAQAPEEQKEFFMARLIAEKNMQEKIRKELKAARVLQKAANKLTFTKYTGGKFLEYVESDLCMVIVFGCAAYASIMGSFCHISSFDYFYRVKGGIVSPQNTLLLAKQMLKLQPAILLYVLGFSHFFLLLKNILGYPTWSSPQSFGYERNIVEQWLAKRRWLAEHAVNEG